MTQHLSSASATVLPFVPRELSGPPAAVPKITDAELQRAIARAHRLRAEAAHDGLRRFFRWFAGGGSLRVLRAPASLPGRRHSCC